ncbi:MAG: hypothetical protein FWD58_03420 [Firmicutes bacterium]|nr:hypothetical protein [Bacillota bacterium]
MDNIQLTASEKDYWITQLCLGAKKGYTVEQTAKQLGVGKELFSTWDSRTRSLIFSPAGWYYSFRKATEGKFRHLKRCVDYHVGIDAPLLGIDTMPTKRKDIRYLFCQHRRHIEEGIKEGEEYVRMLMRERFA